MPNKSDLIKNLRPSLFWDVDSAKLDFEKNADFIIGRVLDFGNLREWQAVKNFYGLIRVKKAAQKHIFADDRSVNFWAMILNLPAKYLKCIKRPSLKIPKAF
ncbi:MAG: hypothetical protein AB1721_02015 [Patescibacteria group bacterium]